MLKLSKLDRYKINEITGKYYRVYDENGEYLYNISQEDELNLDSGHYLKGVTCFVINESGEILVEKRAHTKLTPNALDLVSGHVDNEEIGVQAIIRELREEVGIEEQESSKVNKICTKAVEFCCEGEKSNFFIEFYCLLIKNKNLICNNEEVDSIQWLPMEEVFDLIRQGKTKFPEQGEEINYELIFETVRKMYKNRGIQEERIME